MLDKSVLIAYLRQQKQLSAPDLYFKQPLDIEFLLGKSSNETVKETGQKVKTDSRLEKVARPLIQVTESHKKQNESETQKSPISSRLSSLKTVDQLSIPEKKRPLKKKSSEYAGDSNTNGNDVCETYDQKRAALRVLYYANCTNCQLSQTRKTYVFGSGAANAPVMVIGEAPGQDEDEQGLPFVGAAGQLLTSMLSAIKLDRNKDVFITNILKCRPPENRSPDSAEIICCLPILHKQIAIIQPKALLLLGRIAAHSVLGLTDSIAKLRSVTHQYKSIPAMVIYHPAALLRNAEYKRPAWEDLQKFQLLLTNLGVYELSK